MVFNVVIHVPIKKSRQAPRDISSTTESMIGHVGLHSKMLGRPTQKCKHQAVLGTEVHYHNEKPVPGSDEGRGQQRVSRQQDPRTISVPAAYRIAVPWHAELVPRIVHPACRPPAIDGDQAPGAHRVPGKYIQPKLPVSKSQCLRKDDFTIMIVKSRVLVMLDVAGSEPNMIPPA